MIQDISPDRLDNAFAHRVSTAEDRILLFDSDGKLYVKALDGRICFTTGREVAADGAVYLFSVNEERYFLASEETRTELPGFEYRTIRELRMIRMTLVWTVSFQRTKMSQKPPRECSEMELF